MIARLTQAAVYLLLPVAGILFFGWDWRSVILLYWLENITVGLVTVIAMIRTRQQGPSRIPQNIQFTINGNQLDTSSPSGAPKFLMIGFFMLHYGIFTVVHGVFVFLLIFGFFGGFMSFAHAPLSGEVFTLGSIDFVGILIAWLIASAVQLVLGFRQPAESLPPLGTLFTSPYKRIVVLHLTVLLGVGLIIFFGWPPVAALLLVLLHFLTDLPQLLKPTPPQA